MTKLDRLELMQKTAAPAWWGQFLNVPAVNAARSGFKNVVGNRYVRTLGTGLMGAMGVGYGASALGGMAQGASDLAYKGPMGLAPRERWAHEQRNRIQSEYTPEQIASSRNAVRKGGLIGAGVGLVGTALARNRPILALAAPLVGWSMGRNIAKAINPYSSPTPDPVASFLGEYRGVMSDEEASRITEALHSPELTNNPEYRAQLVQQYSQSMEERPEVKAYRARQKRAKLIGGTIGGLGMAAAMILGSKKGLKPDATKLQKLIGGNVGMAPWIGLAAGTAGMGLATALEGGRRAGLSPEEYRKRAYENALDENAQTLAFYGMGYSPKWRIFGRR